MKNKPYLISLASDSLGVERYLSSLWNLKDSVDWVNVEFKPYFSSGLKRAVGRTISAGHQYPGHLFRWNYIPQDLDPDRWWIFTDTADVIFQAPIPDLDETGKKIIVAYEGISFAENGFWTGLIEHYPQFKNLLEQPVFNVGCWAMRGDEARDFIAYLKARRKEGMHQACEQLIYNQWLETKTPQIMGTHRNLMCTLYAGLERGFVHRDGGAFINQLGEPFSIVHANGNTKNYLTEETRREVN